jgi:hypothetical protein
MTPAGIVIAVGLSVGVVAAAMPSPAVAQRQPQQRDHQEHRERRGGDNSRRDDRRDFDRRDFNRRHHSPRPFVTFYSPPSVISYTYYTPPPVYYVPPVVYQAPPAYYPPPAPAMQRVIEYATGRYELHGDGVVTPYEWAWIPNPPPAPPAPVEPPSVAAARAPVPSTPGSREAFRWTDDNGVTTWTDRVDKIPEQYRTQVQRLR